MKQIFLLIALVSSGIAFGQAPHFYNGTRRASVVNSPRHKTTDVTHDSLYLYNLGPADTDIYTYAFPGDSGFVSGTNIFGYYGFAERYNFNSHDSSISVIGVAALFAGVVTPASTKTVDIKIWNAAGKTAASRPHLFYSGLPTTSANSVSIPYTGLGISGSSVELKEFYFLTPTTVADTFFVGYTTNYTWDSLAGDTIAVGTSKDGNRTSPGYSVSGADTLINVQNATLVPLDTTATAMDIWVDNGFDLGFRINYWLFPIVNTTVFSHEGIRRNDFTFYGNYPNPAVNGTAIKFALAHSSGVKVQVTDAAGRTVKVIDEPALASGEHIIALSTTDMPAGDYLYIIRTSDGDGIAGKIAVIR